MLNNRGYGVMGWNRLCGIQWDGCHSNVLLLDLWVLWKVIYSSSVSTSKQSRCICVCLCSLWSGRVWFGHIYTLFIDWNGGLCVVCVTFYASVSSSTQVLWGHTAAYKHIGILTLDQFQNLSWAIGRCIRARTFVFQSLSFFEISKFNPFSHTLTHMANVISSYNIHESQ